MFGFRMKRGLANKTKQPASGHQKARAPELYGNSSSTMVIYLEPSALKMEKQKPSLAR